MAKRHLAIALFAAIVSITPAQAADTPARPGQWEVSTQTEIPGMPFKLPAIKTSICLTEEDVKDPGKSVPADKNNDCKVTSQEVDGNTVNWTIKCTGKTKGEGEGSITYSDDTYEGFMNFTTEGTEIKSKYKAKRTGDCKK